MTGTRRLGLVVHRRHRSDPIGGLARWLGTCRDDLRAAGLELHAVGGTWDAIHSMRLLDDHPPLHRLPCGHEGGVTVLASRIAGGLHPSESLDGIVFLMDPTDPTSLYPEALALKRQCVIHGKPFVSTVAGAIEWAAIERFMAGGGGQTFTVPASVPPIQASTLALVAHDALKPHMVAFADRHFKLLSRARHRVGTGTTGALLNELAWSKGWPAGQAWIEPFQSGPLGGDAQIAERVLKGDCHRLIFFEDVHVARQHEADIQLLERAVCASTWSASSIHTPEMAQAWAAAWSSAPAAGATS